MNLEIRQLSQRIANVLNESGLPFEVKRLVVHQIYVELNDAAQEAIYHEMNDETHTVQLAEIKESTENTEDVE